jgi:hypothetical protein
VFLLTIDGLPDTGISLLDMTPFRQRCQPSPSLNQGVRPLASCIELSHIFPDVEPFALVVHKRWLLFM